MKKIVILRGPSGSGKTTIANHLLGGSGTPHEADSFWGPNYAFNPNKLHEAHAWCRLSVERDMISGAELVVVSNVNSKIRDMIPYFNLAAEYGYEIKVICSPDGDNWKLSQLEKNGRRRGRVTPSNVIESQLNKFQPYPGEEVWSDLGIFN